jgi:hypothetical protein
MADDCPKCGHSVDAIVGDYCVIDYVVGGDGDERVEVCCCDWLPPVLDSIEPFMRATPLTERQFDDAILRAIMLGKLVPTGTVELRGWFTDGDEVRIGGE